MDAANAGDHWSRCWRRPQLHLVMPLSLIHLCRLRSQWICNDRTGFWIRDGGTLVFKTAGRSGSASNAGCRVTFNATCWVCLWSSSVCWSATNACIRRGGWSIYWLPQCSICGGSHVLSNIRNVRTVQRRWGGGVLTLDCRAYETPSLRGIPITSRYGITSLSRGKWISPWRPTFLLIVTIRKTSNM